MQLWLLWCTGPQSRLPPSSPSLSLITTSISLTTFHAITLGSAGSRVISPHSPNTFQKAELAKRGAGEGRCQYFFFLITYYVPDAWLRKAFLSLCEVGTRTWGPWRRHQFKVKVTESCPKNRHSRKPVPVHNGDTIHDTINTSRGMKKLKAGTV